MNEAGRKVDVPGKVIDVCYMRSYWIGVFDPIGSRDLVPRKAKEKASKKRIKQVNPESVVLENVLIGKELHPWCKLPMVTGRS